MTPNKVSCDTAANADKRSKPESCGLKRPRTITRREKTHEGNQGLNPQPPHRRYVRALKEPGQCNAGAMPGCRNLNVMLVQSLMKAADADRIGRGGMDLRDRYRQGNANQN